MNGPLPNTDAKSKSPGAVSIGTTPVVQYAYTEMSGGVDNSRLTSITYPDGYVLTYNYSSGLNSTISRLSSLSDTTGTLESYKYLGLDTVVERDHPQTDANQTLISQTGGTKSNILGLTFNSDVGTVDVHTDTPHLIGPGPLDDNGNPLGMAAARANLTEVLTPEAYEHLDALNDRILRGCTEVIERYGLSGYSVGVGSKGCVTFSPVKIVDYETFKANQDAELADLAWLFNMNRGIFMTPGREEEWTLSVTHTDESVDQYVAVFDEMAKDLTA